MNRKEKALRKVSGTKELLLSIIDNPSYYKDSSAIRAALISQGVLAHYSNDKIPECSLNTLKSACERNLEGGFEKLDLLRVNALKEIEKAIEQDKPKNITKSGLKEQKEELINELLATRTDNFNLSVLISELREHLKVASESTLPLETRKARYEQINESITAKLAYIEGGK
ncbi:putative uncharacterized protein [Moritella viscosa]|nr:hypothetical protein [Moritella viscosa]CED59785.1 putative uncharacterized protein [Moritella viscosa]SHO03228.1 Putative uncharacterized protein [Moritella viscosa]